LDSPQARSSPLVGMDVRAHGIAPALVTCSIFGPIVSAEMSAKSPQGRILRSHPSIRKSNVPSRLFIHGRARLGTGDQQQLPG
jgi:hypothetical protein